MEILLENGARKRAADGGGNTPLHLAPTVEIAKLLLEERNFLLDTNDEGENPLTTAKTQMKSSLFPIFEGKIKGMENRSQATSRTKRKTAASLQLRPRISKVRCRQATSQPDIDLQNIFSLLPTSAPAETTVLCPTATASECSIRTNYPRSSRYMISKATPVEVRK